MRKAIFIFWVMTCGSAYAASFQGRIDGVFINPTGAKWMKTKGVGTDSFTWGKALRRSNASTLHFEGQAFNAEQNQEFILGTLAYKNGSILNGTDAKKVTLGLGLDVTSPFAIKGNFMATLGLVNTPNNADPKKSADYVIIESLPRAVAFGFEGKTYKLQLTGFGNLSGEGFTDENRFRVFESGSAKVELLGRIESASLTSPVPVPGAAWLFGSALLGLFGYRRKAAR